MSAARGRDRRGVSGRGHLVLVRGGVDHDGEGPDDADWRAFCERIGWQHVEAALPDDYEDRLAARIFQDQDEDELEDPVSLGVARALRAARISAIRRMLDEADDEADDGGPISGTVPSLGPAHLPSAGHDSVPLAFKAAAPLAVAAALFLVASAVLWRAARPSVEAVARPDAEASPRATIAPVVDRTLPMEQTERRTDPSPRARPLRMREGPMRAAPSETKPQKPTNPGSRVALRERRDDARPRGASHPAAMGDALVLPGGSLVPSAMGSGSRLGFGGLPHREPPPRAITMGETMGGAPVASALPVIPHAWPAGDAPYPAAAHVSDAWTPPTLKGARERPSTDVVPASATWSLSPENPRWYGMGLPPSTAPIGVPPGVGVMAQLDLAKAIDGR
jgi:hypothetical protein